MTPRQLEGTIRSLLERSMADAELRKHLEDLATNEISFSGFTWLFGPILYRRNRVLFRPFILSHFSSHMVLPKWRTEQIRWKGDRKKALDQWITEVDAQDDAELFRRLYEWKLTEKLDWRNRDSRDRQIARELLPRINAAPTSAKRETVLRKFDLWFFLDEATACALYERDPQVLGPFILRRLPTTWLGDSSKRKLWTNLIRIAENRKAEDFRWKLYRRQAPLADWTRDCLELCRTISDPATLCRELERRHPEGFHVNLSDAFLQFVQGRGRDVFPYIARHLGQVWRNWLSRGSYGKLADYARDQGWWDLWSALVRTCSGRKEFNKEITRLVDNASLPNETILERLLALAGASREWNWPGIGLVTVHDLEEEVALALYKRFPDLVRGPYRLHVQANLWGESYAKLIDYFLKADDEEMIDHMASRIVTRSGRWGNAAKMLESAERLADYFTGLKSDEVNFSRRAASVLGRIPAYAIGQYNQLIRENRLARLLFERSSTAYLADPRSLADLIEASEIHVMALAYRALGTDDPRARQQATNHLPLLLGTLLRPMQRDTRALAFRALGNAAGSLDAARQIHERARDALFLPDIRYPKEKLLALIAGLIHRWPELRGPNERPVVHERPAA